MFKFISILRDGFRQVLQELKGAKLRSFLSLLGVTIGIFCIISVLSAVDSLERNLQYGLEKLGSNILYVQKWPWGAAGEEYKWWEYINRPNPSYREFRMLDDKLENAENVVIEIFLNSKKVKAGRSEVRNVDIAGVSEKFDRMYELEFSKGRWFSTLESVSGSNVAVIGATVADELFPANVDPIGKEIWVLGRKTRIVGVLQKEGESLIDFSYDENVLLPYEYLRHTRNIDRPGQDRLILVQATEGVSMDELKDEITPFMRAYRRLRPKENDDFALNEITLATNALQQTFSVFNLIGMIIGAFSVLVGGFGVANIMFVSVRERTPIIGIKKALGAKRVFILLEFLLESVILCLIGCVIGLGLVYITLKVAENALNFDFVLSMKNILLGVGISTFLGVLFGIIPAIMASRMDPVDAMRS